MENDFSHVDWTHSWLVITAITLKSLPFWRDHQNKFPGLALLARHLFCIPITSAEVERQFSSAGLTVTQYHSSLDPDIVNDVLLVRSVQNFLHSKLDYFSKH